MTKTVQMIEEWVNIRTGTAVLRVFFFGGEKEKEKSQLVEIWRM